MKTKKILKTTLLTAALFMASLGGGFAYAKSLPVAAETVTLGETMDTVSPITPPVVNVPNETYLTWEETGIDKDAIFATAPESLGESYKNGVFSLPDRGFERVNLSLNAGGYVELTKTDNVWSIETGLTDEQIAQGYDIYFSVGDTNYTYCWNYDTSRCEVDNIYGGNGYDVYKTSWDSYLYEVNDLEIFPYYQDGQLKQEEVRSRHDNNMIWISYNAEGSLIQIFMCTDTWYYYYPSTGWEDDNVPVGYEDKTEAWFMEQAPCQIPGIPSSPSIPSVDYEVILPEFEFVDRVYETIEESGFPIEEIKNAFPLNIETKYENGKYMVKDIGAFGVEFFTTIDYMRSNMTLEEGYWTIEISEELYNSVREQGENFAVDIYAEDRLWQVVYFNGTLKDNIQLATPGNVYVVLIYTNLDIVEFAYPDAFDNNKMYRDTYINGDLQTQIVYYFERSALYATYYQADGSFMYTELYLYEQGSFYYYSPEGVWATNYNFDSEYICDAPAGYEDCDVDFFTSLTSTNINCQHQIVIEEAQAPTCTEPGLSQGSYCSICQSVFEKQEEVPELGHDYDEGVVTKEPTATEKGEKTFTCQHDKEHTYTEEIPATGAPVTPDDSSSDSSDSSGDVADSSSKEDSSTGDMTQERLFDCKSSITGSSMGLITLVGAAAVVFSKKRKQK